MRSPKYSKSVNADFSVTLNKRVSTYFRENGISSEAGPSMVGKTVLLLGVYSLLYIAAISNHISSLSFLFVLWGLMGLVQSFIGMSIMHDTVHGAYTKNKIYQALLQIPIILIGVEPKIWHIEHNVLHHNYPNVEGIDQDINPRVLFRFTKHQPRHWHHRFQHVYATFLYGLLVIEWLTVKDFMKAFRFYRMGYIPTQIEAIYLAITIFIKKLIFFLVFLVIPLKVLSIDPFLIVGMFLTMLIVAGISLTIVFQLAHVVPECKTEKDGNALQNQSWHDHQMQTTANFAHDNKLLTYLIGGLNYQVEHHLFPTICHSHYPELSKIVKQTAAEFGNPYYYEETFIGAIRSHYKLLKNLGKGNDE